MHLHPSTLLQKVGFETIRARLISLSESVYGREQIEQLAFKTKKPELRQHLKETVEVKSLLEAGESFPLQNIPDIREWLEKCNAEGSILPVQSFGEIRQVAAIARILPAFIRQRRHAFDLLAIPKITAHIQPLKPLEEEIDRFLDNHGEVRSDATPKLRTIRQKINNNRTKVRRTVQRIMQRLQSQGMTSDEGMTIRGGRMVIPIQVEYKRKVQGFIHDVSSSGQTVFLEPVEALTLNNEIRQLEIEEQKEIERILKKLTGSIRRNRNTLWNNVEKLGRLDVILAKARLAHLLEGQYPTVQKDAPLILRDARNPVLLLKQIDGEQADPVVPLDLELETDELCLVITGPNAGGKSVAMKTVALCVLMVQAGIPIPADEQSRLPVFEKIFLDIGDDQSMESDLSTFSSRLAWMKSTLEQADKQSLVLIDEAASGTDPEEGGALYEAFLEELIRRNCRIVVTTHHGSLKIFADNHEHAVNGSMEFDMEHLSPTYRFRKGVPGSSYAFEIASRMEVDAPVINRAKQLLGAPKRNLETLINELEVQAQQARESHDTYRGLKKEVNELKKRYKNKLQSVQAKRDELRKEALREAEEIVNQANSKVEQVIQEISERGQALEKKDIKRARQAIADKKQEVQQAVEREEQETAEKKKSDKEAPSVGDWVRVGNASTTGELVEVHGKEAEVLVNGLRIKTNYHKLEKTADAGEAQSSRKTKRRYTSDYNPRGQLSPSLMIRGMRAREAMQKVERYLDDAVAAGFHQVQIIHGKGEGILKAQVHEYLARRPEIKNYYIAPVHQGGAGCTIVELA